MYEYSSISCEFQSHISSRILRYINGQLFEKREELENLVEKETRRLNVSNLMKEVEKVDNCIELIELNLEEIEISDSILIVLRIFENEIERLKIKINAISQENEFLCELIYDFRARLDIAISSFKSMQLKIRQAQKYYQMRFNECNKVLFNYDLESDDTDSYGLSEIISNELKPYSNIVQDYFLDYRNDMALSWCTNLLEFYQNKTVDHSIKYLGDIYLLIGRVYMSNKDYINADLALKKALSNFQSDNDRGYAFKLLGINHQKVQHYERALNYFQKSMKAREAIMGHFHPDIVDVYRRVGLIKNILKDYNESNEYLLSALTALEYTIDKSDPAIVKSVALIFDNYIELGLLDKAKLYGKRLSKIGFINMNTTLHSKDCPFDILVGKNKDGKYLYDKLGPINKCYSSYHIYLFSKYVRKFTKNHSLDKLKEWCHESDFEVENITEIYEVSIERSASDLSETGVSEKKIGSKLSNEIANEKKKVTSKIRDLIKSKKKKKKK